MTNTKTYIECKWLAALLLAALLLAACDGDKAGSSRHTEALRHLDTLIDTQAADAPHVADEGMRTAPDSMTYHEYGARKARWLCLTATPDSMVHYADAAIDFARRQPDTQRRNTLLAYVYNCKAVYYHNFHRNTAEVIDLYRTSYRYAMQSDLLQQTPSICANMGDAYMFGNQLAEAARWYRRALFLVDSLRLPKKENVSLYVGLANIYMMLGDYNSSISYYKQTEAYVPQLSLSMQAYYLNNFGSYYYYTKDYANALHKFRQLQRLLEANGKTECFDMFLCKLNMADVYLNLDSLQQSEKCLDESRQFFTAKKDAEAVYYCNTIRIGQQVKRGDMQGVTRTLADERQQLGPDSDDRVMFSMRQIRNRYLQRYYLATGNYRTAYENLKQDMQKDDSLEHKRMNMRASEIMNRFAQDTLKLHHELALEQKGAELEKTRLTALSAVLLLAVVCLLLAVRNLRTSKRFETIRNRVMQLKLEEIRNRISPHFVFNVLNNKILHTDSSDTQELLDLARLIRKNLDLSCQMKVTLAVEIDFVKQYLAVQTPLMGNNFTFTLDVDPGVDMEHTFIPSMFVQILVENALVHGLRGWEGDKTLTVSIAHRHDGITEVAVTDNGRGFDIRQKNKQRIGLNIITQTLAVVNERNRNKMTFALQNVKRDDGSVAGCRAQVCIPDGFVM